MTSQALADVKVVEIARFVAGPYCGKLMADLGAEVIKVEPPSGDVARDRRAFLYLNTNKLGVTLDIGSPQGRDVFSELLSTADVLISDRTESRHMGVGPGLDYAAIRRNNPRLVITCITAFGLTGPYRDFKAYYLNTYHGSGLGYLTPASPDLKREPTRMGGFAGECACGVSAAVAALAALFWRRMTGRGQIIDVSQQEALLSMNRPQAARHPNEGVTPTRVDQPAGTGGLMECKDGHIVAIFADGRQWKAFAELMGNPEWATPDYEDLSYRGVHYGEIRPRIEAWMREHTTEDIFTRGQALGCPISPVLSPKDALAFPQFQSRGFFVSQDFGGGGKVTFPGAPFRLSATPWRLERPAPTLGQHNDEVYCGRLGYSYEVLVKLRRQGVI
ncbi:MAG: CoA transferase [Chloroflexi bacterium]|nr:CoA transferase [Chloroflexota bacterium]